MSTFAELQKRLRKPRPAKLERADRRSTLRERDKQESAKAKARANGRCEVVVLDETPRVPKRCPRRDLHTHHMLGGIGRRLTERGIAAERKQRVCDRCHDDITGNVLQRVGGTDPHYTDPYFRAR